MNIHEKASQFVAQMTLAEKASLCSGKDFWNLKGIERLGLPGIMVSDGPHGLRKEAGDPTRSDLGRSVPAVCFPTASATACSFDRGLMAEIGRAIGEECRQENVAVLLGPGMNIKRSPLCGRNFEYFSEDPFVTGEMAAAFIEGVQSQDVGTSIKHFAANNQETRRLVIDAVLDERTLREIYLAGFERAVRKAHPWTVMCAYNQVMGEFASQSKRLLTDILRGEWGFDGLVMTDWGAVVDRVRGVAAGLDLEMPHLNDVSDQQIVEAVEKGRLSLDELDAAARRVTALILRAMARTEFQYDADAHHALARRAAVQSAVLLKNEGNILPGRVHGNAAVIGAFAKQPRYQGSGSSKIAPIRLDNAFEELTKLGLEPDYADGYRMDSDEADEALIAEACQVAAGKDIVYLFAGLPDSFEAEGFDRQSMAMPDSHVRLIEALSEANPHVVVVLHGGAPMEMSWAERVPGILLMHLGGEAGGGACADLLLGRANPGGRLAESWPFTHADAPSHANFPGSPLTVEYREGLFVGYRYYDTAHKAVRYPFGHGLSYTRFDYADLHLSAAQMKDTGTLTVTCRVTNPGGRAGAEVVQLYVACKDSVIIRAAQELKGFERVWLEPGESREVRFDLSQRDFAYYNTALGGWHLESGDYVVRIGASSRDIRLAGTVNVQSTVHAELPDCRESAPGYYDLSTGAAVSDEDFAFVLGRAIPPAERQAGSRHTINSTITDIRDNWIGRRIYANFERQIAALGKENPDLQAMAEKMLPDMPVRFLSMMTKGGMSIVQVKGLVDVLNGNLVRGLPNLLKKPKKG